MKAKSTFSLKGKKALLLLYIGVVVFRFLLALLTSMYPTVGIDEFLYYNLARSIAMEGKLIFRGQPADYCFVVYPLVLSPVYMIFGEGANFFRILQLWNILLLSTAIFPIWGLCKACLRDEKKALLLTVAFMLLPDFLLGQRYLSEAILYPMFYTTLYCAYRYITKKEGRQLIFLGILSGLMYFTKPGYIVPPMVFLAVSLLHSLIKKEKKQLLSSLLGLGAFAAVFGLIFLMVRFGFQSNAGLLSLYDNQVNASRGLHLDVFFRALALYPYYFILACGIMGVVYPLRQYPYWHPENKQFALYLLFSLMVLMVGTAWSINHHEYYLDTIHLRYIAGYIPMALLCCVLPCQDNKPLPKGNSEKKSSLVILAVLGYTVLCTLIFGCDAGTELTDCNPCMSLALLLSNGKLSLGVRWAVNILILALCGITYALLKSKKQQKKLPVYCTWLMIGLFCINTIQGYADAIKKTIPSAAASGQEVAAQINNQEYIYIRSDESVMNHVLDVNTKQNANFIMMYDLCNHLSSTNGIYTPFVPDSYRAQRDVGPLPDVNMLVIDDVTFGNTELSQYATQEDYQTMHIVRFEKGKPLFKSVISNLRNASLTANHTGILLVFDEECIRQPIKMRFRIESDVEQTFSIFCTSEIHEIPLIKGNQWYEVVFQTPQDAYNFKAPQHNIKIHEYEILPLN